MAARSCRLAQQVKDPQPILVDDDRLAVNEAALYRQAFDRLHDAREAVSEPASDKQPK